MLLFLRLYSQKPHLAGTERQHELANLLAQKLREYGFDDVELPSYKVLLSYPIEDDPNIISILAENGTIVSNITQQITVRLFFNVLKYIRPCNILHLPALPVYVCFGNFLILKFLM